MSIRKSSKNKEIVEVVENKAVCKVSDCGMKARTAGFCVNCYIKHSKGFLTTNGEKTLAVITQEKTKEAQSKKDRVRSKEKQRQKDKSNFRKEFAEKPNLLKILQNTHPDIKNTRWCPKLEFWTCDAICFHRIFAAPYPDEACVGCHLLDDKFEWLNKTIAEVNVNVQEK